ncbi:MAG: glutaredoxin domain-containing protein [Pseudomonadota bacterium]
MKTTMRRWGLAACLAALGCVPAWAQYKVVGPDGKVTYTDRPPPAAESKLAPLGRNPREAGGADAALPYALRSVASRYPVTLYTTSDCEACDRGRQLLRQRGVPFRERTANTDADRAAWPQVVGGNQAPALSIGSQKLTGLSESAWHSYLDAAGYPRESQLPASYRPPAPQPLVAPAAAQPEPSEPAPAAEAATAAPPPASGGFRF